MRKGRFITFEGGEGTGKTTQIRLLTDYLQARGIDVLATKEPGGTEVGKELRRILCTGDKDKMDAVAEALLYYADRRVHMQSKVLPALNEGRWVISDRFADSTMAYQYYGYDKRVPKETLEQLYAVTVGDFHPDLTVILDIDPQKDWRVRLNATVRRRNRKFALRAGNWPFTKICAAGSLRLPKARRVMRCLTPTKAWTSCTGKLSKSRKKG